MKKSISKSGARLQIEEFFKNVKNKNPREVKKIKRLAMSYNIPLKEKRKLFCKKCLKPYSGKEKVRIRNNKKIIECENCGEVSRWKL